MIRISGRVELSCHFTSNPVPPLYTSWTRGPPPASHSLKDNSSLNTSSDAITGQGTSEPSLNQACVGGVHCSCELARTRSHFFYLCLSLNVSPVKYNTLSEKGHQIYITAVMTLHSIIQNWQSTHTKKMQKDMELSQQDGIYSLIQSVFLCITVTEFRKFLLTGRNWSNEMDPSMGSIIIVCKCSFIVLSGIAFLVSSLFLLLSQPKEYHSNSLVISFIYLL